MFCDVCKKPITDSKRSTKTYCSGACRSKAYYARKTRNRKARAHTLKSENYVKLQQLGVLNAEAQLAASRIFNVAGDAMLEDTLNIVFCVLARLGLIYNTELNMWEQVRS